VLYMTRSIARRCTGRNADHSFSRGVF
jgi:hypothetical protein